MTDANPGEMQASVPAKRKRSLLMMALAASVAVGAVFAASPSLQNQAYAAGPAKDGDNTAELQRLIDKASAAGGGVVQLEAGTYRVSNPVYLRSGVILRGKGAKTEITNVGLNAGEQWRGVVVFAGNITPISYSGAIGVGYPGRPTSRIDGRTLDMTGCNTAAMPKPGQVIWTSSEALEKGNRGVPLPEFAEMNLVSGISGCRVTLADPISAPARMPLELHWSDRSSTKPLGEPNDTIRDAGLENLKITSDRSQAFVVSGCYNCRFTGLTIGKSLRLFPVQGTRGSLFEDISGTFTQRGIEFAMYGSGNTIRNIRGTYRYEPGIKPRPAIRFGEYARDNTIEDVVMDLRDGFREKIKIRFDGSGGNTLRNVRIVVPGDPAQPDALMYRAANSATVADKRPEGTVIEGVRLCRDPDSESGCVQRK